MRHRHEMTTSNGDHVEVGGKRDWLPDAAEDLRGQLAEARRELEWLRDENQRGGVAWVCCRAMRWPSPSWTRQHRLCSRSLSWRRCQRWMRGYCLRTRSC